MSSRIYCVAIMLSSALAGASPAIAGGFYLQEQSPKEIGRAFSGGAAAADDPSTIFFNPAGMTELEGIQLSTGGTLLFIDSAQTDQGSTRTVAGQTGSVPIAGSDGGNPFHRIVPIPSFYASARVGQSPLWIGLGISAPFGLKLAYEPNFFGRYDSIDSEFKTFNIQPSAAVKLSDAFAVGGGIDVQYAKVDLSNALPNLSSDLPDGQFQVGGDDISIGWNLGILAKLGKARLGLHYRSRVKHQLSGSQELSGLLGALASANGTQDVIAPVPLPDIVTASATLTVKPGTRLMATGRYYNWSVFQRLEIIPETGSPSRRELRYKDSWSIALGAEHDCSERLTLRAGAMFDRTPTNADYLSTRVPDGDRTWASMGATYDLTEHVSINLSYAHVFITEELMDRTDGVYGGAVNVTMLSRSSGNVDMVATSVTARF